jgi:hypothetical protein
MSDSEPADTAPAAPARPAALDDPLTEALVRTRRFFTRAEVSPDLRALHRSGGRGYLTRPYIVYRSRDNSVGSRKPKRGWERVGS